ncbi:MAG: glyoxalase [Deltaproteobacteria bacterium RIFOXYA12_FULL_61_11]|nr:MAG: glyoxalase [Deltaproteobacteria bacterium RIFOXYA12_FULL_61_11]
MQEHLKKHGAFSWFELMTTDVEAAKKFYASVFAWTYQEFPLDGMGQYSVIQVEGEGVGGIMLNPPQAAAVPPYWASYIAVRDIDATAATWLRHGGTVIVPPTDIPAVGRFAVLQDPQGAVISAITYVPDPSA